MGHETMEVEEFIARCWNRDTKFVVRKYCAANPDKCRRGTEWVEDNMEFLFDDDIQEIENGEYLTKKRTDLSEGHIMFLCSYWT